MSVSFKHRSFCLVFLLFSFSDVTTSPIFTSTPATPSCPVNEVSYENHCCYLDGTGGQCSSGYSLGSETMLSQIAPLFMGLNYKTAISDICCVITTAESSNYGMSGFDQCNKQGPFVAVPALHGGGCHNSTGARPRQLTFCVSD